MTVLAAVAFAVALGFGVVAPAIPVFARDFGVGRTAAGAVISAFAFMRLAFALAGGRLVDRLGERAVLGAGIGIVAVSSLLAGLAQSYPQLLVLRAAGGVGSAMFTVAAMTLVLRVAGPAQRGRATGLFQAGFLVGGIAGPAFGGVLTDVSVRAPFFVYAVTLGGAGAIGMLFLSHATLYEDDRADDAGQRTSLRRVFASRAYGTALVANFGVGWTLFGVRSSLLPLFVLEGLQLSATWTGIGLVVSSAGQAALLLPAGRLTDQAGRRPAMVLGGVLTTGSTATLAASSSAAPYLVAMAVLGAGFAFLAVAPGAVVGDVVEGRGGTVVAAFQMAGDLGAVIGPLLAGWLSDTHSYGAAFGVTAGVMGLGAVLGVFLPETRRPRTSA